MPVEKKKLVFFDLVIHFGGAQSCTVLLCGRLKQTEEVHIIDAYGCCWEYMNALAEKDIPVHVLAAHAKEVVIGYKGKRLRRMWAFFGQLPALLKLRRRLVLQMLQIDPDLIWTNNFKSLFFLVSSSKLRRYPICFYAHAWYKKSMVSWFARFLIKHHTDCVLAVSNATKQALQNWGVSEDKIHVVFNTIDFDSISEEGLREPLTRLPGMDRNYKILVPGYLSRTKGQHTAIEAASILRQKGLDFVMWAAGDTSVGDKSGYHQALLELIRVNHLQENVFMLGWRSDVRSLMNLSDAVILPTYTEGLPLVVIEAMILQRVVITTPVGGIADLIIDGETGLLVGVDDKNALAERLERVMCDEDFSRRLAKRAHEHIHANFRTERHVELVQGAFRWAIARKLKEKR